MITYARLGENGRLGNQLFQYSALFSIAFTRGYELGIPSGTKISEVFELQSAKTLDTKLSNGMTYVEPSFMFEPQFFLIPDGSNIDGYLQSGNYFRHCQEALRKDLKFKDHIFDRASDFLRNRSTVPLCSLHIRRGDYQSLSHYHKNLGSEYYQNACNIVKANVPNAKFLVFSDDPEWCKSVFVDTELFEIVETGDDSLDLCIMSRCPLHVIANSSFSWWGAWLSSSPAVIAPKEWFAENGPKEWSTIYEPGWIVI